jgi:glycosyltransferase involved in cell wall biosynthesis
MIADKLTVVIPCKNEAGYIEDTLRSLNTQIGIEDVDVVIADARSTDGTVDIINRLVKSGELRFKVHLINGGRTPVARNLGAYYIQKDYIVFLDADTTLTSRCAILWAFNLLDGRLSESEHNLKFDLITCRFESRSPSFLSKTAFRIFNWVNCNILPEPFAVGAFFATSRAAFEQHGGFDESTFHSEDYLLSRKYNKDGFAILTSFSATQDDRRFKRMGYLKFLWMMLVNYINRNNIYHFRKDIKYWD